MLSLRDLIILERQQFVVESGNAVKGVGPVPAYITPLVYKDVEDRIHKVDSKVQMAPLGSLGKKLDTDFNGDIDIAINIPKREDLLTFIQKVFPECTVEEGTLNPRTNEEIVSIAFKWNKEGKSGVAQVDFMVTDNLKWAKWRYDSPDFRKGESKYKAQAKDWVIRCVVSAIPVEEAEKRYFDDNGKEIKDNWKYTFNFKGVVKQLLRSKMKSNGEFTKPKKEKEFEQMISNDPDDVMKFIFGKDATPEDFKSAESVWKALHSSKWKWGKEALEKAEQRFYDEYIYGKEGKGIDLDPKDFPCTEYEYNK